MDTASSGHGTFHIIELVLSGLGSLVVIFLGIQIRQIFNMNNKISNVAEKLDLHILAMAKALPSKVGIDTCSVVRKECLGLNKTIIQIPLEKRIDAILLKCKENKHLQEQEKESIWRAIRAHSHTHFEHPDTDKVVLK